MNLSSQYADYHDSGISWLGRVPTHWSVTKLKHEVPFQVGWTPPTKNDANFEGNNLWANISDLKSKVLFDTSKRISDEAAAAASMDITPKGSLLYSFKLSVGAVAFAGVDMYTNEAIASFLNNKRLPLDYLYYAFPIFVIHNASTNIYGARILNQDLIKNAALLAPSYEEASQIAKFLDYETAKIDALIEKQQQLIALLKEKRQAVISHAVTKGLNPDAPMRDSGVEWLGEVPAHWEKVSLKSFCDVRDGTHETPNYVNSSNESVPLVTSKHISAGEVRLDEAKHIAQADYEAIARRSLVERGDILMPMIGSVGGAVLVKTDVPFGIKNVALFKASNAYCSRWLQLLLDSDMSLVQFDLMRAGGVQSFISLTTLRNLVFLYPPLEEQQAIAYHLDKQCDKFDWVVQRQEKAVELLQERRTALISAAVTGKIDVRGWKAPESKTEKETA